MSTASLDIPAVLEQARSGDTGAFAQIVRQYQSLVSGVLYNATGDFHKSEDIAQETFLIAWQKLGELREPQHLAAWLCTIARNLAHRSHRKPTISTETGGLTPAALVSNSLAPDAELLRREQSELVWSAIGKIDEKHRETLVLYYRSGQSVKEIADATESTEEAVRQRLVRARKSLKSKIEEMVGNILTDTAPGEVFTMTVMTALGVTMLTTTAQAAVAGTVATGTAVGTGSAATGKTLGVATIWSVIGPVAYAGWFIAFWFSMFWTTVRNAPTLRARRFQVYSVFWTIQYFALFCIAIGCAFATLIPRFLLQGTFAVPIMFAFSFFIVFSFVLPLQWSHRRKMKGIIENDLGLPGEYVESYSYQQVERRFFLSIITNLLLAITVLAGWWGIAMVEGDMNNHSIHISILCTIVVVGLVLAVYYPFGRYFLEICRTKENFLAAPPLLDNPLESALIKSVKPSVERAKKTGKLRGFQLIFWGGLVMFTLWYLSWFSWDKHPNPLGFCVFLFIIFFVIGVLLGEKIKSRKGAAHLNILLCLGTAAWMHCMEYIEFGGIDFWGVWGNTSSQPLNNLVRTMHRVILLQTTFVMLPIYFFRWGKAKQEKSNDKDSNKGELLREAIVRYNPAEMIADEPEVLAKPFPRRWIWIIGLYAAALVVLWCVGVWRF